MTGERGQADVQRPRSDESAVSATEAGPIARFRWARIAPVVAIALLVWLSLAAWAVASPIGASPDDDYHLAMLYCTADKAECVLEGARVGPCYTMKPDVPAASCRDDGDSTLPATEGILTGHYPPLYYATMAPLVGDTLADTTRAIRLFNVTLATVLAVGSVLLSSRALRPAVAVAWVIAPVPLGMFFMASVNPTAWVVMGLAALWGPLLSWLTAPGGPGAVWAGPRGRWLAWGRLAFVAGCALMGLGTRSEAALWLPLVAAAVAVFALPWPLRGVASRPGLLRLAVPVALVVASAVTLMIYGQDKAQRLASGGSGAAVTAPYRGWDVVQRSVNSALGMFGMPGVPGSGLGTYDIPVPAVAAAAVVCAAGGAALLGIAVMYGRKVVALVGLGSASFSAVALLWSRQTGEYYQPRYFLPLLFLGLGLTLLPRPDVAGNAGDHLNSRTRPVPPARPGTSPQLGTSLQLGSPPQLGSALQLAAILAAAALANALALVSTMLRYLRGVQYQPTRDPLTPNAPIIGPGELRVLETPSWWLGPLAPWPTAVVGALAFFGVTALVWWWLTHNATAAAPGAQADVHAGTTTPTATEANVGAPPA